MGNRRLAEAAPCAVGLPGQRARGCGGRERRPETRAQSREGGSIRENGRRGSSLSATSGKAGGLTEVERLKAAWPFGL
jgi:hypothetical protein